MSALPTPGPADAWGAALNNAIKSVNLSGLESALPGSGDFTGQQYTATDTGKIRRWNGTTWDVVATTIGETSWTNATLVNLWVTLGGAYPTPGFRKDAEGRVWLRGVIKSGASGSTAFTLPSGYRPTAKWSSAPLAPSTAAQVDVNADGTVVPASTSTTYIGLDGLAFYTT